MHAAVEDVPQPSVEQRRPACRAGPSAYHVPEIAHSVRGGSRFAEPPRSPFSSRLFASIRYGKSMPYTSDPYPSIGSLTPSTVVFAVDNDAFLKFYVNLLTLPVPVDF
jgi:hypothetical protein